MASLTASSENKFHTINLGHEEALQLAEELLNRVRDKNPLSINIRVDNCNKFLYVRVDSDIDTCDTREYENIGNKNSMPTREEQTDTMMMEEAYGPYS